MTQQPPAAPANTPKKKQADWIVRIIVAVVLLVAAVIVLMYRSQKNEFNRIIELANSGKDEQAVAGFEKLVAKAWWSVKTEARAELVQAYLRMGDAQGLKESVEWYDKATKLDPDCLDASRRQKLDLGRKAQ